MIAIVGGYGQGMTMRVPRSPGAGETVTGGELTVEHGGKGSNQAIAAARLGARSRLVTAVGDDEAGREARRLWADEGVDAHAATIPGAATMTGFILVEPSGENRICIAAGALELLARADVEAGLDGIGPDDTVLVSLEVPIDVALHALHIGRSRGARTILNPAPVPIGERLSLADADVITPNRGELAALAGAEVPESSADAEITARRLREESGFDGLIVVTLGADGALVDDGTTTRVPAHRVAEVVDTTGAGDAFSAALAVALAEGAAPVDAARFANVAGAAAVTGAGVVPALARRHEIDRLMTSGGSAT